ncbi:hypothetical protein Tsubulata_035581 [Turnera subulata]|uniref:DRBM domain-containing protein n=1 Tax=Turnera subulata TaxID=218843 RepID=A0A9Q0FXA6_9ROSI|nr:hypothetical protein Tsubulata_035581 [Turnera subulata]
MYKSKLQVVCQKQGWGLPEYETTKIGLDHLPEFRATVTVNSLSFHSQSLARSSKEAQNDAARLAFLHFSPPLPPQEDAAASSPSTTPSHPPPPPPTAAPSAAAFPAQQSNQPLPAYPSAAVNATSLQDLHHLLKNQLQSYTQKRNLALPVYCCERHGPPHACRFKGKVMVDGKMFETQELFTTVNRAELAAAKIALMSLLPDGIEQASLDDLSYKNLLQEFAQKKGYPLPVYSTARAGEVHVPIFTSTVEIGGGDFKGQEARTKKQAEMNAARVAYFALNHCNASQSRNPVSPASLGQEAPEVSVSSLRADLTTYLQQNVQPKLPIRNERVGNGGPQSSHGIGTVASSAGSNAPPLTNLAINSAIEHLVGVSSLCQNRVFVHPRKAEVTYPTGSSVLPVSDDTWVAVKVAPSVNQ